MTRDESVGERSIYLRRHLEHLSHDPDIGSNIVEFHIEASPSHCSASSIPLPSRLESKALVQRLSTRIIFPSKMELWNSMLGWNHQRSSDRVGTNTLILIVGIDLNGVDTKFSSVISIK